MKGVYGVQDGLCDTQKGFVFLLVPARGGYTKRCHLRVVPESLHFFDSREDTFNLQQQVISAEKLFLDAISNDQCSLHFMCPSKDTPNGVEGITSA